MPRFDCIILFDTSRGDALIIEEDIIELLVCCMSCWRGDREGEGEREEVGVVVGVAADVVVGDDDPTLICSV